MKYLDEMDQLLAGFLKETDEAASLRSGGIISSWNRGVGTAAVQTFLERWLVRGGSVMLSQSLVSQVGGA